MNGSENRDDWESEVWLDRLEALANEKASSSQNVADLEKAASAAALIANARMLREDLKHHRFRLRLDDAKGWAFLAIPFLIFTALLVFIPRPNQQAQAIREAGADANFREVERNFLAQISTSGAARPDLLLLTAPLQAYLRDPAYEKEVRDLLILALAHAGSPDAFQDYFVSRNIRVDAHTLPAMLTLDRMLYTNFNELDDAVNSDQATSGAILPGRSLTKEQGQRARDAALLELTFLSAKIAAHLRAYKSEPLDADLRRVYFKGVDLGGILFGKSNLEGGQWETVSLSNANLSSVTEFDNSQWIDADWWDAKAISKPLLSYLISNQYPYHPPVVDYSNAPASREMYEQKVLRLCAAAELDCSGRVMPYGLPPKADKSDKKSKTSS